jgi:hypothetical protein
VRESQSQAQEYFHAAISPARCLPRSNGVSDRRVALYRQTHASKAHENLPESMILREAAFRGRPIKRLGLSRPGGAVTGERLLVLGEVGANAWRSRIGVLLPRSEAFAILDPSP